MNRYAYVFNRPLHLVDPTGRKTECATAIAEDGTLTLTINAYIEFVGHSRYFETAASIASAIEETYSGTVTLEKGTKVVVETKVEWALTEDGGQFESQNYDQIQIGGFGLFGTNGGGDLFEGRGHYSSEIVGEGSLEDPYTTRMTNSLVGGITRGRIHPWELDKQPGAPSHEFGHILGFVFHLSGGPATDPMSTRGSYAPPSVHEIQPYQVRWFMEVVAHRIEQSEACR